MHTILYDMKVYKYGINIIIKLYNSSYDQTDHNLHYI